MKIAVYGICKDEKAFIARMLDTIKEADAIVFCDTGSTDGTYEVLEEFAKTHPCMIVKKVHVNPWRFDDARNIALFSIPKDVDICVSLDADELVEPGWYKLLSDKVESDILANGKPFERYNHRFKTIWDWESASKNVSEHWHERIHIRHGFQWKLPVHEHLVKCDGTPENIGWIKELTMIQKPDTKKSRGSYLPLLEKSAKEDPKRWKTFSFLAGEYQGVGNFDKAIEALEHAIKQEGSDKSFLSYQKSKIYEAKKDFDWAAIEMLNACKAAPHVREYRVYLAQVYLNANRKSDAIVQLEIASKITERTFGYEYNPGCWGDAFNSFYNSIKS